MKPSLFLFTLLLLTSCNNEVDNLKVENEELKVEIEILKSKLDNAFVIPYDSISQYMMPVTCGADELSVNEEAQFGTFIAWPKFPDGIEYNWKIDSGEGILRNPDKSEAYKYVEYHHSEKGEKEIRGSYNLTLPNGVIKELAWLKPTVVK